MPGKVKVRVLSARHLPVMDRSSENTDAFVEVRFGDTVHKTEVCRKSLNPVWNSEWFRFEAADDKELQDEPLSIRIMDYDTYSANDAIGKVYVDLNPLLFPQKSTVKTEEAPPNLRHSSSIDVSSADVSVSGQPSGSGATMTGWLPIYDTIHGIRGEINLVVKVELFSDFNKFRESSCGVQFFCNHSVPEGYKAVAINGFVEELVVSDDPEYDWIDKIRTPRASNEARQHLFMKMSGAVRRKIGLKAIDLGGNAVVGYQQKFDLEGDTGIVVRAIGTAMNLIRTELCPPTAAQTSDIPQASTKESLENADLPSNVAMTHHHTASEAHSIPGDGQRGSPDSENVSPKASNSSSYTDASKLTNRFSTGSHLNAVDLLEYPFITLKKFPPGFILRIGGFVSCRSVKLLDGLEDDECGETRDGWWQEIRQEVRSHARCLGCNVIVGYSEETVIWEDVVVICASGTAAFANMTYMLDLDSHGSLYGPPFIPVGGKRIIPEERTSLNERSYSPTGSAAIGGPDSSNSNPSCSLLHVPYVDFNLPFTCKTAKCTSCGKGRVPDILFTTLEPPAGIEIIGRGCLVQSKVLRLKRDLKGEHNAKEISDALPFIEYETQRRLLNKLRIKGMNSLFGLKTRVSIGDRTIIATATATACFLAALPVPCHPKLTIASGSAWHSQDSQALSRSQKRLELKIAENEEYYGLQSHSSRRQQHPSVSSTDEGLLSGSLGTIDIGSEQSDGVTDEGTTCEVDFSIGNKDTCVLEIDDNEDADLLESLMDPLPPPMIQVFSTEELIGIPMGYVVKSCQTFSQVWRGRIHPSSRDLSSACQRLLTGIYFKLRRQRPCLISNVNYTAELDEENELQLYIYGTAITLEEVVTTSGGKKLQLATNGSSADAQCDQDSVGKSGGADDPHHFYKTYHLTGGNPLTSLKFYSSVSERKNIQVTPLSYIPGAVVARHLGNLNFFLIRETSSLRESGGLNNFIQAFLSEVFSLVRAHVKALGGNALVAYFMSEFVVNHSPYKNQGQCLIHVGGDAVSVVYQTVP